MDALAKHPEPLKRARRKAAYRLTLEDRTWLLKVGDARSLAPWRRLGPSAARRALACAERLVRAGVATPTPVAIGERRSAGWLVESYELLPWLPAAVDLARARDEGIGTPAERRTRSRELGALVRAIHEAGVDQDDLAPNNFLWQREPAPRLLAVDFERARVRSVSEMARVASLAKLERYCGGETAASRMRFLRAYSGGDRDATRRLWRSVEAASADLWRRDVARWTGVARRGGRRFVPLPGEAGARGRVRRDVDAAALREALRGGASDAWFVVRLAVSPRDARRCFGAALALHQRGLALRPDAFLPGESELAIGYARAQPLRALDASLARSWRGALVVTLDRLLALGALDEARLRGGLICSAAGVIYASDPRVVSLGAAIATDRRSRARALADALARTDQVDALR